MLEMLLLINAERAQPLVLDPVLSEIATERAEYLCNRPFSHDGWVSFIQDVHYTHAGENLAKGFKTDRKAHKALMKSPTHKANIVNPWYKEVGIGKAACGKKPDIIVELFTS